MLLLNNISEIRIFAKDFSPFISRLKSSEFNAKIENDTETKYQYFVDGIIEVVFKFKDKEYITEYSKDRIKSYMMVKGGRKGERVCVEFSDVAFYRADLEKLTESEYDVSVRGVL